MLYLINSIALKKILLNIFFSTFTIPGKHQGNASDTLLRVPEPKMPPKIQKATPDPKPHKCNKSASPKTEESYDFLLATPAKPLCHKKSRIVFPSAKPTRICQKGF